MTIAVLLAVLIVLWAQLTQPLWSVKSLPAGVRVDAHRLRAHVETLSRTFYPRDVNHPDRLSQAANYIREAFALSSSDVHLQHFDFNGRRYSNVIAGFGPASRERIIIGAHYDTAGEQPGADDNASGVAGLLELAMLLKQASLPLRVELAAYTLEEPPLFRSDDMGSARHVRQLQQQQVRVRLMIALEMIGYFNDTPGSQFYPLPGMKWLYPAAADYIAVVGRFLDGRNVRTVKRAMRQASPLPVYSLNAPVSVPGVDFSDHLNFWKAGMPAVMITDTAFYRNAAYHSAQDTAERLDYSRMAMVIQGVYAAILEVAAEK